jgi:Transcription elongation factor, GreA/GreB, C-term
MNAQDLIVSIGASVTLELLGDDEPERLTLVIVPDEQADFYAGYLGESTPLAKAIISHSAGEIIHCQTGQVRIIEVTPIENSTQQAKENAALRKKSVEQARKEIDRTNAIVFSSTIEGKWGEYDTDAIDW